MKQGDVQPEEQVVIFNTGAAQKYVEVIEVDLPSITAPVDYVALQAPAAD